MKLEIDPISLTRVAHAFLAVLIVFALTVVFIIIGPKMLGEGVIALLYLVPIGWCTVRWGKIAGVSAAFTAALSFDFYFIPPYNTLNIGSLEGWLLLFLFIAAAILVVGRIQSILWQELSREREATFLYEMVVDIAYRQTREGIAEAIANMFQQKFLARLVKVQLYGRGRLQPITAQADHGPDFSPRGKPDRTLPVISGPDLIGEIKIWKGLLPLPPEEDHLMQTILHQIAVALDRAQNAQENIPSTVQS